jgi:hypothetical protein
MGRALRDSFDPVALIVLAPFRAAGARGEAT